MLPCLIKHGVLVLLTKFVVVSYLLEAGLYEIASGGPAPADVHLFHKDDQFDYTTTIVNNGKLVIYVTY